ncbi:MAG: hypothetical protein WDN45_08950 [Caulobacteraceae bacterium]
MAVFKKWGVAAVVVAGIAALATGVVAQDKAAAVKARQDFMKAQGADTKAISDYSKGMGSKDDAAKAIADLQARSGKIAALFVSGHQHRRSAGRQLHQGRRLLRAGQGGRGRRQPEGDRGQGRRRHRHRHARGRGHGLRRPGPQGLRRLPHPVPRT